jgi:hypothetical protein
MVWEKVHHAGNEIHRDAEKINEYLTFSQRQRQQ